MLKNRNRWRGRAAGFLLVAATALGAASPAAAVDLAQVPLFVNLAVAPNVMLQFDNSGSMNNIMWDERYDPEVDYDNTRSQFTLTRLVAAAIYCREDEDEGEDTDNDGNNDAVQCYILPAPSRNITRYHQDYLDWIVSEYPPPENGDHIDLRDGRIPQSSRFQVARQVTLQIIDDNPNVNLGLARFNGNNGGTVVAPCGASQVELRAAGLLQPFPTFTPSGNTPLAETYYEITRYFRGLEGFEGRSFGVENDPYQSPITLRCQRNFVVSITDGLPTFDETFPEDDPDDLSVQGRTLPDWDNENPETTGFPYPQYSDGTCENDPSCGNRGEGATLYLDDLADFGFDLDLKTEGNDEAGGSYEDPEFDPQRLETYTVGLTLDNQMLQDAAEYGNGQYFTADTAEELTDALQGVLSDIRERTSTAASLASTSTQASTDTQLFRATFNSGSWSGDLAAFDFGQQPALSTPSWNASEELPAPGARNIFTLNDGRTAVPFEWGQIGEDGRSQIRGCCDGVINSAFNGGSGVTSSQVGEQILEYIRGDESQAQENGGDFRNRESLLGDIVHSTPAFVGDQNYGYNILPGAAGSSYSAYFSGKGSRADVVLVGANDGMLHAFNPGTGEERFAYVPRQVFGELEELAEPGYGQFDDRPHRYYVDGSPAIGDAYLDGNWRTIAVTTLGRGGSGLFALDMTDPGNFGPDDVLWEIDSSRSTTNTPSNEITDDFVGQAMGQPAIARLENGDWVAILGNGYNSDLREAALIIVDLETGEVLRVLRTGADNDNGLATPAAIDRDGNGSVDTVYAGDLEGNLWKFDLSGDSRGDWNVAYGGDPLITATDADDNRQPITARPDAITHPNGRVMVVFGTGRYLSESDPQNTDTQSVYGVWDNAGSFDADGNELADDEITPVADRSDLIEQTVEIETVAGGRNVRILSRNNVEYPEDRGWVFNLSRDGERISRDVTIFDGRAILVSTIPDPDPCTFGGDSALIEINPLFGTQFDEPVLDLNEDDEFDDEDGTEVDDNYDGNGGGDGSTIVYPGIIDLDVGLATNPFILTRPDGSGNQTKLISGSKLNTESLGEKGFTQPGRASWLQLR